MEKREQIRQWFTKKSFLKSTLGYVTGLPAFLGVFLGLISFDDIIKQEEYGTFGIILLMILPFIILFFINENKPEFDESILDKWLEEDITEIIRNRPYDKLGVLKEDLVADSLLVVGPIFWNTSGFSKEDILTKKGKDGFNRYTTWTIQIFAFTENYLCSYKCHYNWIKNTYINESTNEFFYKDVVSVKTDTISSAYTLINGERLVHSEAFQLKLSGDEITVITNDASLNTSSIMVSKAEKAVQSIRAMLRDKKK